MNASTATRSAETLERHLLGLVERAREGAREDPFGNPVLAVALAITRLVDRGQATEEGLEALIHRLGVQACGERATRLRGYVGLSGDEADERHAYEEIAGRLVAAAPDLEALRAAVERVRFGAVFTAHPTFAMPRDLCALLARAASAGSSSARHALVEEAGPSFRPDSPITLDLEFAQACDAARNARDAIDALAVAILRAARARFPDAWATLAPRPLVVASWVGCDTDGRTDINWWDTLRFRLTSKHMQLERVLRDLPDDPCAEAAKTLATAARGAVEAQLALAPPLGAEPDLEAVRRFAVAVVEGRETAQTDSGALVAAVSDGLGACADDAARLAMLVVRSGLLAHGLSHAHPHFRLNASQVHNALRRAVQIDADPADPAQRRAHLAAVNGLLDRVAAVPLDFGALAAERASATRLIMTVAQILKHVDGSHPVRFLIAETETGYTLLAALWLARRFGIGDRIEITPLFETAEALEQGPRILDEALRSPHFRDHLLKVGRLVIQFGYSDSGRYVGQLAATYEVERLRLKLAGVLARHDLAGLELVLFDTHGESIGRGAHPDSLGDRLAYLAPAESRRQLAESGHPVRLETSFQGSDGYLLMGTRALAGATVARLAEHALFPPPAEADPIYDDPDFAAGFFTTIRQGMQGLVEDRGYAALLGTFGPGLLDKTGSRPAARQSDSGGPAAITHPAQLRAIPNNAILQQMGWLANSLCGLGRAASRAPDAVRQMRAESDRFGRALRLAEGAMRLSDLDVLRAYVDTLDPGIWLDRARRTSRPERRDELLAVAAALERLDLATALRGLFRRLGADWLLYRSVAPDVPAMPARLVLLHALRLALVHRIWFLAVHVPDFRPQPGLTREALIARVLRLDVPASLEALATIFPVAPDATLGLDFGEPAGPREGGTYEAQHATLFEPMRRAFAAVREVTAVVGIEAGAFG
jgi:phosphoenolpyruvate carboxylase